MIFDKLVIQASKFLSVIPKVVIHVAEGECDRALDRVMGYRPNLVVKHVVKDDVIISTNDSPLGESIGGNCRRIQKLLNKYYMVNTIYAVDPSTVREILDCRKDKVVLLRTGTGWVVANFLFNKGVVDNG